MNILQYTILDIYREIQRICDLAGLRYFAIGGTAIGTIRHKGFIPWDDDLDIAMPIEDYKTFVDIAPKLLNSKYELILSDNILPYRHVFAKVSNIQTALIEGYISALPDRYTGVWVDIMPMSGVPEKHWQRQFFIFQLSMLEKLNRRRRLPYSTTKTIHGKIIYIIAMPLKYITKYDYASRRYMDLLYKHPFDEAIFTGYTWSTKLKSLIFPKEWFSDYILMPFEDTQIRMPVGYDEYLTQQFGDYMTVPPPEQQITHRVFADLEHSYKDYQSGKIQIPEGYFDSEE